MPPRIQSPRQLFAMNYSKTQPLQPQQIKDGKTHPPPTQPHFMTTQPSQLSLFKDTTTRPSLAQSPKDKTQPSHLSLPKDTITTRPSLSQSPRDSKTQPSQTSLFRASRSQSQQLVWPRDKAQHSRTSLPIGNKAHSQQALWPRHSMTQLSQTQLFKDGRTQPVQPLPFKGSAFDATVTRPSTKPNEGTPHNIWTRGQHQ